MVNSIMRISGEETVTMSRSFLMKKYNYSHCPLKKRPIQYIKEELIDDKDLSDDNSEPENLSTKPEDLSCKTLTPPPAIALVSVKKIEEDEQNGIPHPAFNSTERSFGQHFLTKSGSGGPLEPLNLNTSVNHSHDQPQNPSWPRTVPAHYPPHYIPLNYIYPAQSEVLPPYYYSSPSPTRLPHEPISPYEPCGSPTRHAFTPFRSHVPVIAALPHPPESRLYLTQPGEHSPLSPTSTSSSNSYPSYYPDPSPPPISPEDLSSPGSVGSNGNDSSGSSSTSSKKKKDSAPRYKCSFCSKSYSTYSGLSKHQQFHCTANEDAASKKKFKCKYCDKEYNSLGALKMHIRTHTLPCKCQLCGKAFSRPWLLQGHIRTHTGEKPFSCPHCNRAFADRSNLRAHLQTHSDVKKYSCPTCSKTFSRMSLLSKHTDGGCPGVSTGVIRVTEDIKSFYLNN